MKRTKTPRLNQLRKDLVFLLIVKVSKNQTPHFLSPIF